ncbi:MAG: protein kinase [Gemmatimonadetes bacterium]|nr:protein kinase [Gemmatimonadota bacterium]
MDPRRWETIQAAFDQVVELDESSRASRLAALGHTDPALRAAVESLLAADDEASARLAPLEAGFLSEAGTASDPLGLAGRTISHFQVLEPLGAGGMGVVYRAQDTHLGRPVALKFLLPTYNFDPAAKTRFMREGHSAAALDHPNLCTIYEVGESEDGRLFLAMALYPGETLRARLAREEALPVPDALEISRQMAQGLACAHAAGIVHRDLKPGNVMLLPDGTVKILDFGLAKARDQNVSETGVRFGTVSYMAPEQILGQAVDGRADLWAVGVVLYEMLTGRKPFGGEHEVAIAHAILHDEPVSPRTLRAEISPALEDLLLTLLQKDRAERYPATDQLLADLGRVGTAGVSSLRAVRARWRRARRMLAGNRRRVTAVGAALLVGALGYGAIDRSRDDGPGTAARTAIAVLPFQNLSAEGPHAYLAGGLHDEILTQLFKVPALKVIGRTSVMGYSGPDAPPLRQIASELGVGSVVEGSVQVAGERVRVNVQLIDVASEAPVWVEQYDGTLDDAFAFQRDMAQQIVATLGVALSSADRTALTAVPTARVDAYLLFLEGLQYQRRPGFVRGNFEAAQQLYERALVLDPDFALAHAALSRVHGFMYWLRYDMTPARLARQREAAEAALRLAPDLPQARVAMGHVHAVGPADSRAALEEYRVALRGSPNDADAWRWVAQAHRRLGEWDQFSVALEKAVQLDPRNTTLLWDQGGGTYQRMGRYADAVRWFDRALSISPDFHPAAISKGWSYFYSTGRLDTLRAVLSPLLERAGPGRGWSAEHANVLLYERRADSLLQVLAAAQVPVFEAALQFDPRSLYAAWAHQLRGDGVAARAAFDSALVVLDTAIVKFPDDWPVHRARGMALAGLGRRDEARREARWLLECLIYRKDAYLRPGVALGAARILAQAGEASAALDVIEGLLAERSSALSVHALRLDPRLDPIREHPRFKTLLAEYVRS